MTRTGSASNDLALTLRALESFAGSDKLRARIEALEGKFCGASGQTVRALLSAEGIYDEALSSARVLKSIAGQVNVILHSLGILLALPHVLEDGEVVERLSLGAGNSPQRRHDLETNRRIAEFTFIQWCGRDAARQDKLFRDLFNLASSASPKRRQLFIVGKAHPLRFLESSRRKIVSVLRRDSRALTRFQKRHRDIVTVSAYYRGVMQRVEIVDLVDLVPLFRT